MSRQESKALVRELKSQFLILGGFTALMWISETIDVFLLGGRLNFFGIHPRQGDGLLGILFAPFLHGGFPHLIANTIPFLTLGWFVMLRETSDFFVVTATTMLVGGLGVWLFGTPGVHIGASILIFGYLGFLLLRGYFERNLTSIFLSVVVGCLYGSAIWGVLPTQRGISWEGHLFGFVGGVIAAWFLAKRR